MYQNIRRFNRKKPPAGLKFRVVIPNVRFVFGVNITHDVNPEYKPYVRYEHGKKVLYVRILKALYGMIESAVLWYGLAKGFLYFRALRAK